MLDARGLKLIPRWPTPGRRHAMSIFWHRVNELSCACQWPHGNCYDSPCPCVKHKYDMR